MSLTLVVMAAGLGSRFGGTKQLAVIGADGEAFLDFAIKDAMAAGMDKVVLIVLYDIEADVRRHVAGQHPDLDDDVLACAREERAVGLARFLR